MLEDILNDITKERARQDEKWGPQFHPDKSSDFFDWPSFPCTSDGMRWLNNRRAIKGLMAWDSVLYEELMEVFEEMGISQEHLRQELIEVAAVCVAWITDLDSREQ